MASAKQDLVSVTCPRCGYTQSEPRLAYSSVCKNCQQHFRLEDVLRPSAKSPKPIIDQKRVRCFQCGAELEAPKAAASTMCKRCSAYVDLSDYRITQTISKNFRTHGWVVVEEKGYLLNTDCLAAEAVIKGRVIGKLVARGTLEIHSGANIQGQIGAGRLVIPAGNAFHWSDLLRAGAFEIAGELDANIQCTGTVLLRAGARFFGDIEAAQLIIESGAVMVGKARAGKALPGIVPA